jgi:iron(III) transport system ATP-binding protein
VHGALTETPFGQFLAPGVPDGTEVEIVFRPQHVRIDFDRNGGRAQPDAAGWHARARRRQARALHGRESLVEFQMDFDASILKATVPAVFLPKPGTPLWLSIRGIAASFSQESAKGLPAGARRCVLGL